MALFFGAKKNGFRKNRGNVCCKSENMQISEIISMRIVENTKPFIKF